MDVFKKPGRKPGCIKTGGRQKGSRNKSTLSFGDALVSKVFSIPEKAMELYQSTNNEELRLKILVFLATYSHSKVKDIDPVIPETEADVETQELSDDELLKVIK